MATLWSFDHHRQIKAGYEVAFLEFSSLDKFTFGRWIFSFLLWLQSGKPKMNWLLLHYNVILLWEMGSSKYPESSWEGIPLESTLFPTTHSFNAEISPILKYCPYHSVNGSFFKASFWLRLFELRADPLFEPFSRFYNKLVKAGHVWICR